MTDRLYTDFADWLDRYLEEGLPEDTAAVNFNIYEETDFHWSVQLIAAGSFDPQDDQWACEEIFSTGEDLFAWRQEAQWEEILEAAKALAGRYLAEGKHAAALKDCSAVTVGFVDGDLEMLYIK